MKKNLVLTGMMGSGKSTVGKMLAKALKLKFLDIDHLIEKNEKLTIEQIFKNKGENYFRKIEKKTTIDCLKKNKIVIALGGGAFLDNATRKEVKNCSITFWLDLDVKLLLPRLSNVKKRPLLDHENLEYSINKIYNKRKKIYNESHFRINCNSLNIKEIVNKIKRLYENASN